MITERTGEENGNPLQYYCLEYPKDGGAWWAAIYGVAQSQTRLKRLSSSIPGVSPRGPPSRGFALTRGPEAAATRGSRPGQGEGSRPRPRGSGGPRSRQARWPGRLPGARPRKMSDWLLSPGSGLGRLFPKEFRTPPPSSSRPGLGTLAKKVRGTGEPGPPGGPCGKSAVSFPVQCS